MENIVDYTKVSSTADEQKLNKLKAEQRILELFETEEIEKVDITYKIRESACEKPT